MSFLVYNVLNMDTDFLKKKAREIRALTLKALIASGSGHLAGSFSMADFFSALYFGGIMKYDSKKPDWSERDILILSNGHICPALYASMALAGFFSKEEIVTLRSFGSKLQGHPHREFLPGLETSSGPLGSGLSQAVGVALAKRLDKKSEFVFCLMSDGELNEGNSWEAIMFANKEKLGNLIAVVDRNNIQISGQTEDIMSLEPLADKWRSFGWQTLEIDGHDFNQIIRAFGQAKRNNFEPTVIIAKTISARGIKEWENDFCWHGKVPKTKEEISLAGKYFPEINF